MCKRLATTPLLLLLCVAGGAGGCATIRVTDPPRSATEQFLMSQAVTSALAQLNVDALRDRKVWVADSFEGLPVPDEKEFPLEAQAHAGPVMSKLFNHLAVGIEDVKRNFEAYGLMDDNVHAQNSIRLVDALQQAGKDFELMVYPRARHGLGSPHYVRLQLGFIRRTMGVAAP